MTTKSSFYFKYDDNKVNTNLRILNKKSPGNPYFIPSVALPHESVDIQNYLDPNLTEDELFEIYGYYTHLVDLHIS